MHTKLSICGYYEYGGMGLTPDPAGSRSHLLEVSVNIIVISRISAVPFFVLYHRN